MTLAPPHIPDAGAELARKLRGRLTAGAPWLPPIREDGTAVPANYVNAGNSWFRVEITRFYIASSPMKTLHVEARVSLRRAGDRGDPYWSTFRIYTGMAYGGERLDEDRLAKDAALLPREIDRATNWLANAVANELANAR